MCMSLEDYAKNTLWPILVDTVHALVMYPNHKTYTREVILHEKPNINSTELAVRLRIPLGEAWVILHELKEQAT